MTDVPAGLIWRPPNAADYSFIVSHVDAWWGGRAMQAMVPRLFIDHFGGTSRVVIDERGAPVAFLIGFQSPDDPALAYIHFIGVDPAARGRGLGRALYEDFFTRMGALGCREVSCVTSPANAASISFHGALGFTAEPSETATPDGTPYVVDYDGPGEDRVHFHRGI